MKKKTSWGLEGLYQKTTGVFCYRIMRQGKRVSVSLKTKDHAEALERALKLQNQLPSNTPNSIGTLLDAYILAKKREHSRFSSTDKYSVLKRFAEKFGECTPLESVQASDLEGYFTMDMEHLAESTLAGYESTIRAFLNWCQKKKGVDARSLLGCLDEFEYDFQSRENFLSQKEVVRLVKQCDQVSEDFSDIKYVIICAGFLGMRKNEIIESKAVWGLSTFLSAYFLNNNGYLEEAAEVASRLIRVFAADITTNGCLHEFYHGDTGQPLINPGFLSWNVMALGLMDNLKRNIDPTTGSLLG